MTNFIPIFPLNIVAFPTEQINLHIFEPRYKQLITECYELQKPFGLPIVLNNQVQEFGTTIIINEIVKKYDNGNLDIKTTAHQLFRILELVKSIPNKLYSGAIVNYLNNQTLTKQTLQQQVITMVKELHRLAETSKNYKKPDKELMSYDVAHHVGLSLEEEYQFLQLLTEPQRLEFLRRHLKKMIQQLNRVDDMKYKIQLNGHFKELSGFSFDGL